MSAYHGSYAPDEASLFDEQMSLAPSFSTSIDGNGGAELSTPMHDATSYGAGPSNGHHGVGVFTDPAAGMYRPPSTDGLYSVFQPTSMPAYSGVVAPFSQVYQDHRHLSPFGQFAPMPTASTSASGPSVLSSAQAYPANFTTAPSVLAVQGMVHQQSRVQQHPGFLDPRQQVALLQQQDDQGAGISLATITPRQVESFSIASTPSTSDSPPPSSAAPNARASKSSTTTTRKVSGSADSTAKKPSAAASSSAARAKRPPSASPAPSAYDPQEWLSLLPTIRSNLTQKRLQTAALSTAPKLLKDLRLFSHEGSADSPWGDASDVPPEGRAEVLHSLLQHAKEEFWRVFLDVGKQAAVKGKGKSQPGVDDSDDSLRSDALDLLQAWLEGASKSIVREKAQAGPSTEKDRKRKELEQATLAYVLKVRSTFTACLCYEFVSARPGPKKRKKRDVDLRGRSFTNACSSWWEPALAYGHFRARTCGSRLRPPTRSFASSPAHSPLEILDRLRNMRSCNYCHIVAKSSWMQPRLNLVISIEKGENRQERFRAQRLRLWVFAYLFAQQHSSCRSTVRA